MTRTSGLRLLWGAWIVREEQVLTSGSTEVIAFQKERTMLDMPIQTAIRTCREFAKLSVLRAAQMSGLTETQVIGFEVGDIRLSGYELLRLAMTTRQAVEVRCARLKKQRARIREKHRRAAERLVEREKRVLDDRMYRVRVEALAAARMKWVEIRAARRAAQISLPEGIKSAAVQRTVAASMQP